MIQEGNAHMSQVDETEIERFINAWEEGKFQVADEKREIKCDGLENFLEDFSKRRKKDLQSGNCVDFFENRLLGKSEMNFSAVLAWLLRSDGDHGFGNVFFKKFMQLCDINEQTDGKCTVETERELDDVFWQTTCTPVKGVSRADIFWENDTVVGIIEVKVDARESGDQLCRY